MKNIIILLLIFFILQCNYVLAQFNIDKNQFSKMFGLQPAQDLSYDELLNLKIIELKRIGDAFKYYQELNGNAYTIDSASDYVILNFNTDEKNRYNTQKILKFMIYWVEK